MLIEASLLVSVYHTTRHSLIFSTGLGMTLQSQYCTPLKRLDMNGWTHSSCWRLWFTCKAPANSRAPSALISFSLRLQKCQRTTEKKGGSYKSMNAPKISPPSKKRPNPLFWMKLLQRFFLCPKSPTDYATVLQHWKRIVVLCVYMLRRKRYSIFSNGCHPQIVAALK